MTHAEHVNHMKRQLFIDDTWACARMTPHGSYLDSETLSTSEVGSRRKAAATDKRLPRFAELCPVVDAVLVVLDVRRYGDRDRLDELAAELRSKTEKGS